MYTDYANLVMGVHPRWSLLDSSIYNNNIHQFQHHLRFRKGNFLFQVEGLVTSLHCHTHTRCSATFSRRTDASNQETHGTKEREKSRHYTDSKRP